MRAIDRLGRRYARLMWAYPRWYREERGRELVTTLLDDAPPGRRRPTRVDVVDILRGGLRARLLPPRAVGPVVVTLFVATFTALVGWSLAVLLSPYPGPPTEAQAAAVASLATGRTPHNVPGTFHCFADCPQWVPGDEVMAFDAPLDRMDSAVVHYGTSPDTATVEVAHERLAAAGWAVDPVTVQSDGHHFRASRGPLGAFVVSWTSERTLEVHVSKNISSVALVGVAAGGLAGLLVGWTIAVSALHRYRRHREVYRVATAVAAGPFLLVAPIMTILAAMMFVADGLNAGLSPEDVQIPLMFTMGPWPITAIAVLSALAARTLTMRPRRPDRSPLAPLRSTG